MSAVFEIKRPKSNIKLYLIIRRQLHRSHYYQIHQRFAIVVRGTHVVYYWDENYAAPTMVISDI